MQTTSLDRESQGRMYGAVVRRWRAGELDDKRFERAYRLRLQKVVQPIFLLIFVSVAGFDWASRDLPFSKHLERLPMWLAIWIVFALAVAVRGDGYARFSARNLVLRRRREAAEAHQAALPRRAK